MKINQIIIGLVGLIFFASCGVSQVDYDKLKSENGLLKTELDECKSGAEKVIATVE